MSDRDTSLRFASFNYPHRSLRLIFIASGVVGMFLVLTALALAASGNLDFG
jgi:hypothetical protein